MRVAYLDCFSGIAGDMCLGALLDAGWPLAELQDVVRRLGLTGVEVQAAAVRRGGLAATQARVEVAPEARRKHRHLPQILTIIEQAELPEQPRQAAARVFRRLAEAEAAVHGTALEKVHFHEVGANDAIVDIVGACVGLSALGVTKVFCSPLPTGHGMVRCEHGEMPIPAPATAQLLRGVPLAACDEPGELTTPTGAALAVTLAEQFGPLPAMRIDALGYGAGSREGQTRPNLFRLLIGEYEASAASETSGPTSAGGAQDLIAVLEAELDDSTGQALAHACERLLAAGALDAYLTPVLMKKGRPGHLLTVLAARADADRLMELILTDTSTFGVRRQDATRRKLLRSITPVKTEYGPVRVKVGCREAGQEPVRAWPEYEDCAGAAARHGVALWTVQQAALEAWRHGRGKGQTPERPG
jgi:uncharacterized protein (TIGR00299 family) protein